MGAFATHRLTQKLNATLSGNYATTKALGIRSVDLTSYGVSAVLTYDVVKWARLTTGYSYYNQQNEGAVGASFIRNQVWVSLTVTWY